MPKNTFWNRLQAELHRQKPRLQFQIIFISDVFFKIRICLSLSVISYKMLTDSVTGLDAFVPYCKPMVTHLGVKFYNCLSFEKQIYLLAKVKSFLSGNDLEKALYALISSCHDYCNTL